MTTLVLNAGSSTLKFALFDAEARDELASGRVDWRASGSATLVFTSPDGEASPVRADVTSYADAVRAVIRCASERGLASSIRAVGHRIVHGGAEFRNAVAIDRRVHRSLAALGQLAPLHNPAALTTLEASQAALPGAVQVAAFDTAFFATLPPHRVVYPLPYHWYERYGIRRFGFHGISHAYCSARAAELLGRTRDDSLRLVICHLGSGCSATAVRGGHAVATSMGFTPLEGLMMSTRGGSVDPGILLYLLQRRGLGAAELEECLNRQSGLLGVSGVSSDFRDVEAAANAGHTRARLAIDMFVDRIKSSIGSLAVALGGIDALVFTAGIGENSPLLRSAVCEGLECLGVRLDEDANRSASPDRGVSAADSAASILVVRTREEKMIAYDVLRVLQVTAGVAAVNAPAPPTPR